MKKFFLLMASVLMIGTFAISCDPEQPEDPGKQEKPEEKPEEKPPERETPKLFPY